MKHVFFSFILGLSTLSSNDFFWGVAISEYQNSGSETVSNCNWAEWEKVSGKHSGKSNNHFDNYHTHIAALEELGCNAFRFSLEWSLIEKEEGVFDLSVVERYKEEIKELKKRGITPFVTMHHFTEPLWFTEKGGFEKEENLECFEAFATFIFKELHEEVKYWAVINEPTVNAYMPYHLADWPPENRDIQLGFDVLKNLLEAHVNVYEICKKIDPLAQIGFVHSFLPFTSYTSWNLIEVIPAYYMTKNFNEGVFNFFLNGNISVGIPFKGSLVFEDKRAPDSYDFVGVNYYSTPIIKFDPINGEEVVYPSCYKGGVMTDMPYHIDPEGFYNTLIKCKEFKKPIYVTENGIADSKDDRREGFIKGYIDALKRAQKDGSDIKGYFYWTLFDNFEWDHGYDMQFGLFNLDVETGTIKLKDGGAAYKDIINSGVPSSATVKKSSEEEEEKKLSKTEDVKVKKAPLVLYVRESCPYCKKVEAFLAANNIQVIIKDATASYNKRFLMEHGHKTQVPCLFIGEKALFESDDIIAFLKSRL